MADYAGEYSRQHSGDSFDNLQRLTYIKCKTGKTSGNGIINNDECQHKNKDEDNGGLSIQKLQQNTNNAKCSCDHPQEQGAKVEQTTHKHGTRMMSCYMKAGMHAKNAIRKARWDWRQVSTFSDDS